MNITNWYPYEDMKPITNIKSDPQNLGSFAELPDEILEIIFEILAEHPQMAGIQLKHPSLVCRTFHIVSVNFLRKIALLDLPQDNHIDSSWMDSYGDSEF